MFYPSFVFLFLYGEAHIARCALLEGCIFETGSVCCDE